MIAPPSLKLVRVGVVRVVCWLVLALLALLALPAFAGDTQEVDTFILTGPDAVTASTTADFTYRASLPHRAAEFWCALDDEEYAPCNGGEWHREGLTPGPHQFWVYAYDPVTGREDDSPASWEWRVEEAPPPLDAGTDAGLPAGDAGTDVDGGAPVGDAGTGESDGGPSGNTDAGTDPGSDAGTGGGDDAGTPGEDAGTGDDGGRPDSVPPGDSGPPSALDYLGGGMGCTGAPAPGAVAGLVLLVLALRRRRRG